MNIPSSGFIAAAARSLVAADPPRPLRPRVMARLDPPRRHARVAWRLPLAAIVMALAAAAINVWPARISVPPVDGPLPVALMPLKLPALPQSLLDDWPAPAREMAPSASAAHRPSPAEVAWRADATPALTEPAPLVVAVSQPGSLSIALLDVPPPAVPGVVVEPIDPARWTRER